MNKKLLSLTALSVMASWTMYAMEAEEYSERMNCIQNDYITFKLRNPDTGNFESILFSKETPPQKDAELYIESICKLLSPLAEEALRAIALISHKGKRSYFPGSYDPYDKETRYVEIKDNEELQEILAQKVKWNNGFKVIVNGGVGHLFFPKHQDMHSNNSSSD